MEAELVTTRAFLCPHCHEHRFNYEHLCGPQTVQRSYIWSCGQCITKVNFSMGVDDKVTIDSFVVPKYPKALILLRLTPSEDDNLKKPLFLILEKSNYSHSENIDEFSKSQEYFYNDHTCPSNYLGDAIVLYDGDDDRHGIFSFVEAIWMSEDYDYCEFHNSGGDYSELFASLKNSS